MGLQLTTSTFKRLLYLILITSTALFTQYHSGSSQSYWLIWSALFLSLITYGDNFKQRISLILITGLAAAFSVFIADSISSLTPVLMIYLFILTTFCIYISQTYPEYFYSAMIINLFTIIASGMSVEWVQSTQQFVWISGGTAIALFFQIIFYPKFMQNEIHAYLITALESLKKLNNDIFACLLDAEYPDNVYLYERRIHTQKNRFMRAMGRLREISTLAEEKMNPEEKKQHQQRLTQLDFLFDNILDYSQIRRRVTDHTTFSVCSQELSAILQEINKSLDGAMECIIDKNGYPNTDALLQKINQLENSYNHVLQIASREPLPFLLFIDSLTAFKENVEIFASAPTAALS